MRTRRAALLLDEMFAPTVAAALRERDHDVQAVAERPDLRSRTDQELFMWAAEDGRWLVTENVKDFRPILLQATQAEAPVCGLLLTSSRRFPRSRKDPGPLIEALDAWLRDGPPDGPLREAWLLPR
jgi:predicted nuclease of predicted toxin-antitoxin system